MSLKHEALNRVPEADYNLEDITDLVQGLITIDPNAYDNKCGSGGSGGSSGGAHCTAGGGGHGGGAGGGTGRG